MKRLALVVLALILLVSMISGAAAQAPTTVSVGNYTVAVDQEIDVPILVSNARDWYGVDVRLAYDPAIVQAVSVTRGVIPQPDFVLWERFDNVTGMAYYVTTQLNPTLPANGDGLVATVRIKALTDGQTPLTLTVTASDRYGNALHVLVLSGQLAVGAPVATATAMPTVAPTAAPTATPTAVRCPGIFWKGRCIGLF